MATTITDIQEQKKGRDLEFKFNGTKVGQVMSFSPNIEQDVKDVSNFDSGDWAEFLSGRKSWNVSVTAKRIVDASGSSVQADIEETLLNTNGTGSVEFGPSSPTTGDRIYSGDVYVQNYSFDAEDDEYIESTWELQGTGPVSSSVTA